MTRNKKLLSNALIFIVGNLGSKLLSFLLVPMYTYFLTIEQYGTIDLLITSLNLCLPLISLSLFDAVFRFVMNKQMAATEVLSTGFVSMGALLLGLGLISPVLAFLHIPNAFLFVLILGSTAILTMFQNFVRAYGQAKIFAISGIVNSFILAFLSILLIAFMKMKVEGYLLSYLVATLIAITYLVARMKLWQFIRLTAFSKELVVKMLQYSVPLIPNTLVWWLTNCVGRFFILYFVGIAANGLFAVANKVPTIINLFFTIFLQAWQISVVDEYNSPDRSRYYSRVFKSLQQCLFLLVALLISLIKPMMAILFANDYYESWQYMPILLVAVVFMNLASFLGTIYLAAEKTTGLFATTVYGVVINLLVGGCLTPVIGINGTGIGMGAGFLVTMLLRLQALNKFVEILMPWKVVNVSLIGILMITLGLYSTSLMIEALLMGVGLVLVVVINREIIVSLVGLVVSLISKKVTQMGKNHNVD